MGVSRFTASSVLLLTLGAGLPEAVAARQWRMTPAAQAFEYTQVLDKRPNGEIVMVWWVAPEILEGHSPDTDKAKAILRAYLLVGVAHARISPSGQFTFERPTGVLIQTADGKARQPLGDRAIPHTVIGIMSTLQAAFSQGLGQFGQDTEWLVFDAKGIESCQKGAFWISYAGEQYGYATPIPGCR